MAEDTRTIVTEAVCVLERADEHVRRTKPDLSASEWRALLAARWTLIDVFEKDGHRYVLARRGAGATRGFDALTAREHEALRHLQAGHSNKLIAHEMGIAASTVAVLLYRAAKKLDVKRAELVDVYTRLLRGR